MVMLVPDNVFQSPSSRMAVTVCCPLIKWGPEYDGNIWMKGDASTVMTTSSLAVYCVSSAVKRRTYFPGSENVARLVVLMGRLNVTAPGPVTLLQSKIGGFPVGRFKSGPGGF